MTAPRPARIAGDRRLFRQPCNESWPRGGTKAGAVSNRASGSGRRRTELGPSDVRAPAVVRRDEVVDCCYNSPAGNDFRHSPAIGMTIFTVPTAWRTTVRLANANASSSGWAILVDYQTFSQNLTPSSPQVSLLTRPSSPSNGEFYRSSHHPLAHLPISVS